jgi:hypothetical protein
MVETSYLYDGVFSKNASSKKRTSAYDQFINHKKFFSQEQDELHKFTCKYEQLIKNYNMTFDVLAKLEEVIMQLRALEKVEDHIKYYIGGRNSEYVYVFAPFYRSNVNNKHISDIIGKTEELGTDLKKFETDTYRAKAAGYLKNKMMDIVNNNIKNVENILQEKFGNNFINL